jgi:hypothetical protein
LFLACVEVATLARFGVCEQRESFAEFQLNLVGVDNPKACCDLPVKLFLRDRGIHDEHGKKQCEASYDTELLEPGLHVNAVEGATWHVPFP